MERGAEQRFRLFAGLARSGTTMLQHALSGLPNTITTRALIVNKDFEPDWSIYRDYTRMGVQNVIDRENIGHHPHQCTAPLFRGLEDLEASKPLFIFRNPIDIYNSWARQGWGNLDHFLTAFRHFNRIATEAVDEQGLGMILTYEELTQAPETSLESILKHWGIEYTKETLNKLVEWQTPFTVEGVTEGTLRFSPERGAQIREHSRANLKKGVHHTLAGGDQRIRRIDGKLVIPNSDLLSIQKNCSEIYNQRAERSRC